MPEDPRFTEVGMGSHGELYSLGFFCRHQHQHIAVNCLFLGQLYYLIFQALFRRELFLQLLLEDSRCGSIRFSVVGSLMPESRRRFGSTKYLSIGTMQQGIHQFNRRQSIVKQNRLELLKKDLKGVNKKIDTLVDLAGDNRIDRETFSSRFDPLTVRRENISQEITKEVLERIEVRKESLHFDIHHISNLKQKDGETLADFPLYDSSEV